MVYKKYSWRVNHGAPAQTVGKTLERIERRDGTITREAFLEESRPEDSPTHACFEWDDSVAAEKYRLNQSSAVIRDIKVTIVSESAEPVKTAAFVNIMPNPTAQEAQYQSVDVAVSDTDTRKTVLQNALDDLIKLRIKYRDLTELAGIFDAIEKAMLYYTAFSSHRLAGHTLLDRTFHTGQADPDLVLEQFADRTQSSVAQMVDVIRVADTVVQVQQIADGSHDVGDEDVLRRQLRLAQMQLLSVSDVAFHFRKTNDAVVISGRHDSCCHW